MTGIIVLMAAVIFSMMGNRVFTAASVRFSMIGERFGTGNPTRTG
jgi:hypothetical protein